MTKMSPHKFNQRGLTLIELIMVIVILGILSAFALPKFADFTSSAQSASIEAALGAVKSGSAIAHAQYLANGSTGTSVTLEGVAIPLTTGYPDQDSLDSLIDPSGYVINEDSAATIISLEAALGSPCFTYTNGSPPTLGSISVVTTAASGATSTCP